MTKYKVNVTIENETYNNWKNTLSAAGYRIFGAGSQLMEINCRIVEAAMSEVINNPEKIKTIMGEVK